MKHVVQYTDSNIYDVYYPGGSYFDGSGFMNYIWEQALRGFCLFACFALFFIVEFSICFVSFMLVKIFFNKPFFYSEVEMGLN